MLEHVGNARVAQGCAQLVLVELRVAPAVGLCTHIRDGHDIVLPQERDQPLDTLVGMADRVHSGHGSCWRSATRGSTSLDPRVTPDEASSYRLGLPAAKQTCGSSPGHPDRGSARFGTQCGRAWGTIGRVTEDLLPILTRFHREVVMPDVKRIVDSLEQRVNARFDEVNGHFDAIYQRFDRLETEYHMIVLGLKRVEERLDRVEQRLDKMALRSEFLELKARVDGLQEQVRALEAQFDK